MEVANEVGKAQVRSQQSLHIVKHSLLQRMKRADHGLNHRPLNNQKRLVSAPTVQPHNLRRAFDSKSSQSEVKSAKVFLKFYDRLQAKLHADLR